MFVLSRVGRFCRRRKEPLRWFLCFSAAGALQFYAFYHSLFYPIGPLSTHRAHAIRVRLRAESRTPDTPLRRSVETPLRTPAHPPAPAPPPPPADVGAPRRARPAAPVRKAILAKDDEELKGAAKKASLHENPLDMAPDAIRKRMEANAPRSLENPPDADERLARAARLTQRVSAESANEIADYLAYQKNTEYVPKDPPPEGTFLYDDAVIYNLEKTTYKDGTPTYRVTLVDREGRTKTFDAPPDEDPSQYDTMYRILQMCKDNESLRVILRRMALPMVARVLKKMREENAQQARRPPQPAPPKQPTPSKQPPKK